MNLNPAIDGHKKAQEAQNEKLGDRAIVTHHDGSIGVQLVPQLGSSGVYNASISGIEIMKP